MATPERKIKDKINKMLDEFGSLVYRYMPVPSGYGGVILDYLVCVDGLFVLIEAKAPGKKPTPRQLAVMDQVCAAGGSVFVVDGESGVEEVRRFIVSLLRQRQTAGVAA